MQGVHLRKYGVETKIPFELYEVDGVDFRVDAADAGSDCSIMKDEGAEATCTNDFVDEGKGYSITLTSTEMQAARIVLYIVDSAAKVWLDKAIEIETYGNASAQHAFDLDDAVRGGMTALPNAAADAAGGLPISDAGGLDLDTKLANTNEVTAARMGVLTDWINGGRLDLILDIIAADTTTDIPALIAALENLSAAEAETACDASLTTYDAPTNAEMDTAHALLATPAEVNAEVVDALNVDTYAEPGQEAPPATTTLTKKIGYLYKAFRNKLTNDGTTLKMYNDAGAVVDQKATVSKADSTVTRGKFGTGP